MTYSFNAAGSWTANHQMTMNSKHDGFTLADFKACAKAASMKRGRAEVIVDEVQQVVSQWRDYAKEAGVPDAWAKAIQRVLRLSEF